MTANAAGQAVRAWAIVGPDSKVRLDRLVEPEQDGEFPELPNGTLAYPYSLLREKGYRAIEVEVRPISSPAQEAGLLRDAERYRWLRNEAYFADGKPDMTWCVTGQCYPGEPIHGRELDAAIDAHLTNAEQPHD